MDVMRASQTHQVPQVGLPQMAPVTRAIKVRAAPMGAQAFMATSAIFIFQIRLTAPASAIT